MYATSKGNPYHPVADEHRRTDCATSKSFSNDLFSEVADAIKVTWKGIAGSAVTSSILTHLVKDIAFVWRGKNIYGSSSHIASFKVF